MKFLSTVLLLGLLLGISVAIIPRRDQSCADNVYESWYYNGQQCMQCYNYNAMDDGRLCFNCNTDGTCSADCVGGYSAASETLYYDLEGNQLTQQQTLDIPDEDYVTADLTYCRRCDVNEGFQGVNCCFMDQKQRFKDTDDFRRTTDNGIHITQCLSNGDLYVDTKGEKTKFLQKGLMTRYGSMCQWLENCAEVGNYGHCKKCNSGFYLDENLKCVGCSNKVWSTNSDDLNTFDITMDEYKTGGQIVSASSSDNGCEICEGRYTCKQCKPGYYLASNYQRESFDRNIAKHASYCLPCAEGCICNESSNLCLKCKESDGWYYNPKTQQCQQCTKYSSKDKDGEYEDRPDMKECKKCEWNENIEDVICIECNARSSDDVSNVIDLDIPFTYKDSDGSIVIVKNKKKICMTCQEAMQVAKKINVKLERKAGKTNEFEIKDDTEAIKDDNIDNREFKSLLFISAFENEQNLITEGCSSCQKLSANAKEQKDGPDTGNSEEAIYFLTCSSCNNGYAEHTIPGGYYVQAKVAGNVRFWQMQEIQTCQRCQALIEQYDKDASYELTSSDSDVADGDKEKKFENFQTERKQLTRRCKRTGDINYYYNQYEITQCGSNDISNNYLQSGNEDYIDRGLSYFKNYSNKEKNGGYNAVNLAEKVSVSKYFTSGDFGYFKVNLSSTSEEFKDSQDKIKNVCVKNINQCKVILDITTSDGTKDNVENSSDKNDPRCESCFPGYIKTVSNKCKECKEGVEGLPVGCIACEKDVEDGQRDEIQCTKCRNNIQCKVQGKSTDTTGETARSKAYTLINYFYSDKTCTPCNQGCLTCEGVNKECSKAQDFWRLVPGSVPPLFEQCTRDFCVQCNDNKDVCEKCQDGYVKLPFKKKTADGSALETVILCEKCGEGCSTCDPDTKGAPFNRTICTACMDGYYLTDEGKCQSKRANCINWKAKGGECLQCAQGYRLTQGWCYSCLDYEGGFKDCPSACDSETKLHSNVRTASQVKLDEELFKKKYPSEPTERILELLDESL